MKISSSPTIRWTRWLDLPMLIALGGVLAVLVMIELLSRGGFLHSASPQENDAFASPPAAWVQQRELSAMCDLVPGRPVHPICDNLNALASPWPATTPDISLASGMGCLTAVSARLKSIPQTPLHRVIFHTAH